MDVRDKEQFKVGHGFLFDRVLTCAFCVLCYFLVSVDVSHSQ